MVMLLMVVIPAMGSDIYVDPEYGVDGNSGTNWENAVATLNYALEIADNNDTLHMANGGEDGFVGTWTTIDNLTLLGGYSPGGGERDPLGNPTHLTANSTATAPVINAKANLQIDGFVIHGANRVEGISFTEGGTLNVVRCRFDRCRIRTKLFGGGLNIQYAFVTVRDCIFDQCGDSGVETAGGFGAYNSEGDIYNCEFIQCGAGNAVSLIAADVTVDSCLVRDGGGIYIHADGMGGTVLNSTVTNCAHGIFLGHGMGSLTAQNNNIVNCSGAGIACDPFYPGDPCEESIYNNNSWSNGDNWAGALGDLTGINGNMSEDPLFVNGPLGNFYLSQIAAGQAVTSPLVDSGTGSVSGSTRTDHVADSGQADIGFHYLLTQDPPDTPPTPTPPPVPTETPVPTHTPTVTPTPDPAAVPRVEVYCSQSVYYPGDRFALETNIYNDGYPREVDFYLLLEAAGQFYFAPGWTQDIQRDNVIVNQGLTHRVELVFDVPDNMQPCGPFAFYGALFVPETFDLIGEISSFFFQFI